LRGAWRGGQEGARRACPGGWIALELPSDSAPPLTPGERGVDMTWSLHPPRYRG
jgi:hypothetical protein